MIRIGHQHAGDSDPPQPRTNVMLYSLLWRAPQASCEGHRQERSAEVRDELHSLAAESRLAPSVRVGTWDLSFLSPKPLMVQVLGFRVDGAFPINSLLATATEFAFHAPGFTGKRQIPEYDLASRYSWHLDTAPDL